MLETPFGWQRTLATLHERFSRRNRLTSRFVDTPLTPSYTTVCISLRWGINHACEGPT